MTYLGRGHTNGDTVIYFPDLRTVHSGDLIIDGMPVIDYNNGGSALEFVKTLNNLLKIDFDTVIPGHGRVLTKDFVRAYVPKLETMNTRMADLVKKRVPKDQLEKQLKLDDLGWHHTVSTGTFMRSIGQYYDESRRRNRGGWGAGGWGGWAGSAGDGLGASRTSTGDTMTYKLLTAGSVLLTLAAAGITVYSQQGDRPARAGHQGTGRSLDDGAVERRPMGPGRSARRVESRDAAEAPAGDGARQNRHRRLARAPGRARPETVRDEGGRQTARHRVLRDPVQDLSRRRPARQPRLQQRCPGVPRPRRHDASRRALPRKHRREAVQRLPAQGHRQRRSGMHQAGARQPRGRHRHARHPDRHDAVEERGGARAGIPGLRRRHRGVGKADRTEGVVRRRAVRVQHAGPGAGAAPAPVSMADSICPS